MASVDKVTNESPRDGVVNLVGKGALCWLASADAAVPSVEQLARDSRALLNRAALILAPRSPAQPLVATLAEIEALEAGAAEIGARLPLVAAPTEQAAHFDRRFGLRRSFDVNVVAPALARATAIATRLRHHPEASPGDIEAIAEGLALCVAGYCDTADRHPTRIPDSNDSEPVAMSPRRQWDEGHQLFAVLGQEAVFILLRLQSALERQDWAAARDNYHDTITLFRAIAATMRRTGAMSSRQYAVVRRSMQPPLLPEGFSGLWDSGHKKILALTRTIGRLPHDHTARAAERRYHLAINLLFHAHACVCEHVAGEKASLAAQAKQSAPPAHVSLRSFARRALIGAGYQMESKP